jgi:hypothetical protein
MATKQTTSFKTTTNLQSGQTQSFRTTYKTSTPTNIGKGGLGAIGRLGMIAITILAISVGSSLTEFTTSDLIETTPNYQLKNDFVSIDDPLNTVNYVQYGSGVFNRLHEFVIGFSDFGLLAKSYWDEVVALFEPEVVDAAVSFLTDFNRIFVSLQDAKDTYDSLSPSNKVAYGVFYDSLNWLTKWMYNSPAELTA